MWSLRTIHDSREAKAPIFHPLFNLLAFLRPPICGTGGSGTRNLRAWSSEVLWSVFLYSRGNINNPVIIQPGI